MTNEALTFAALHAALDRCMRAHPPIGDERRMHPDANAMADLWAPMVLGRLTEVSVDAVDGRVMAAFLRWQAPDWHVTGVGHGADR